MSEVTRYNFFLNTANAIQIPSTGTIPSTSNCQFIIGNPAITLSDEHNYFDCQVITACIPFSFKIINSINNFVNNCVMTINGTPYTFNLVVPSGNYNIDQLLSTFQSILQTQYYTYEPAGNSQFIVQFNIEEGFVDYQIILGSSDTSVSMFLNYSVYPFVGKLFGFYGNVTFSNTVTATSQGHYNVNPVQQLFIRSSLLLSKNYEFVADSFVQQPSDIIASLNLFTGADSYLNGQNVNPLISRLTIKTISAIDIYLTDDQTYIPLDLRKIPMYIHILIIEKSPDVHDNLKDIRMEISRQLKGQGKLPQLMPQAQPNETNGVPETQSNETNGVPQTIPQAPQMQEIPSTSNAEGNPLIPIESENENNDISNIEKLKNLQNALSELNDIKKENLT